MYNYDHNYSALVKQVRSIVISLSVCLSVCPRAYLWDHWTDLHQILCADLLWPWFSPAPEALRYVMYLRFYGWRHVSGVALAGRSLMSMNALLVSAGLWTHT